MEDFSSFQKNVNFPASTANKQTRTTTVNFWFNSIELAIGILGLLSNFME